MKKPKRHSAAILFIAFIAELIESYYFSISEILSGIAYSQMRLSGFVYSAAILYCFSVSSHNGSLYRTLAKIGDYSSGIFFIHYLIILVVRKVFVLPAYPFGALIEFSFALAFSVLLLVTIAKTNNKRIMRIIGI